MSGKKYKPMIELKLMRIKKGLLQADLAKRMGVSQNVISMYETGDRFPSRTNLEKLANALECDIRDII